ncbi:Baseplate J-like protein [compost metagenome]
MAGLSSTGLEILRLPDILTANGQRAQAIFSDQVTPGDVVDITPNSTLGRMIGIVAPAQASLWEAFQQIYNSFNPTTAVGFALDNLVALSGISRFPSAATTAQILLYGTVNTLITTAAKVSSTTTQRLFSLLSPVSLTPEGASGVGVGVTVVLDSTDYTVTYTVDGISFIDITINSGIGATEASILADLKDQFDSVVGGVFTTVVIDTLLRTDRNDPFQIVTFSTSENLSILKVSKLGVAVSDTIGTLGQAAGSINTIAIPVSGWETVTNPLPATPGRFQETDEELRERFRNSKFVQASNIIEALIDALNNVAGVTDVAVYENDTDDVDILGVPPHSFMPIVLGGLNTTIAEAIWQNKPTGILSFGDTTVNILDSQGIAHAVSFRRPTEVPIYVSVEVTDVGGMPGDATAQIQQNVYNAAIEAYLVGDDVIYSRFYTPVNQVPGHAVNSLTIGTAPSPVGTSNIVIDFDEVATFDLDNIIVTVV